MPRLVRESAKIFALGEVACDKAYLSKDNLKIIVTPNPEIVYYAQSHEDYRKILNKADLSLADGIGLTWAKRFLRLTKPSVAPILLLLFEAVSCAFDAWANKKQEVVPGRILFEELIQEAGKHKWKLFLLGGQERVAAQAAQKLSSRYQIPGSRFQVDTGPWLNQKGEPKDKNQAQVERETIKKINEFMPDFLFVAFGHPKQELWLDRNRHKLKVKVAMVVGGAFDYVSQKVPTPPKFISDLGFEWAWRLVTQPTRVGRIYTALVKFPAKVFKEKLKSS